MNVHHLELFYYVARFGGISEAVRNIPYGIQQPAVSGQIIQLEEFLGVTLFQRRPFALTQAGQDLYDFVRPFFGNIEAMASKLQGGVARHIRIGAGETVLRDHLPELMRHIRKKFPDLKITLREASQPQLEPWLNANEIDFAIAALPATPLPGIQTKPLLTMPLVLMVQKNSKLKRADDLWKRDRIEEPLITLFPNELICREFRQALARMNVDWFPSIEVPSLDLIQTYVNKGYGIGLSVRLPLMKLAPGLRLIDLPGFPMVTVGALWRGRPTPLTRMFLEELDKRARTFAPKF